MSRSHEKVTNRRASISNDEAVVRHLRDPEIAAAYLKTAMEETAEPELLLVAVRRVIKALESKLNQRKSGNAHKIR